MLKIGCYTIALNEEKFVERWLQTTKNADYVLVADTGSTDKTFSLLEKAQIDVVPIVVRPWRFDDARNAALALLPSELDVVISLDLDETLADGWRQKIESAWRSNTTRLHYGYVWNWTPDGKPDLIFQSDKISGRFTHRWKAPVHEVLTPTVPETIVNIDSVIIEHHPDSFKSRGQYLHLLKLATLEDPHDDRNSHYLGREYFFYQRYDEAITELKRHLELPHAVWLPERAASMRYIAKCYDAQGDSNKAYNWYTRATLEDLTSREALIDLAQFQLKRLEFFATIGLCEKVLNIPAQSGQYMAERYARAEGPHDLLSVALSHIGQKTAAIQQAELALSYNPDDQRLQKNLQQIKELD